MSAATDFYAALGQCVSAAAAVVGLGYISWQITISRRTADLQALQVFLKDAKEHERDLARANSDDEKEEAFIGYLNFLETYALAYNGNLFPRVSKKIVYQKIVDSLVIIEEHEDYHGKIEAAISTSTTFSEIGLFMKANTKAIKQVREGRAAMRA